MASEPNPDLWRLRQINCQNPFPQKYLIRCRPPYGVSQRCEISQVAPYEGSGSASPDSRVGADFRLGLFRPESFWEVHKK